MKRTFLSHQCSFTTAGRILTGALFAGIFPGIAATPSDAPERAASAIDAREQQRQQERERALLEQNTPQVDARLSRSEAVLPDYPVNESPCFTINQLTLVGEAADRFQWALDAAADAKGRCLGSQGIVLVINKVQNAILAKGYVTSRVMGAGAGPDYGRVDAHAATRAYW